MSLDTGMDLDTAYQAHCQWSSEHGYEPLDRELYEEIRDLKIAMMEGVLEGYRRLGSVGVTFTDEQKEAIQENIRGKSE